MKNLEAFDVKEISFNEANSFNGGYLPFVKAVAEAVTLVIAVGAAVDYAAEEFLKGWNNPR